MLGSNALIENEFDLGKGKRSLVSGGKLAAAYGITVPEEFSGVP